MALYKAQGSLKRTRKLVDGEPTRNSVTASLDARNMVQSGRYKTVVILCDSEGVDHPDNAGKFFLDRIVK